ncbi:MAG: hypothetical protein JNL70_21565 [Saprospiraceae bacterium]|nr:hypothetical protein [Saprospiraceae bacterium]
MTKISDKLEPDTIEQFGPFLKKIIPEYPNIKKYTILYDSYGSQIQFYIYKYKEQQVDVDKIFIPNDPNFNNLKAGQYVITSDNNVEQKLVHTYAAERVTFHYDSRLYRIISKLPVAKDSTKK